MRQSKTERSLPAREGVFLGISSAVVGVCVSQNLDTQFDSKTEPRKTKRALSTARGFVLLRTSPVVVGVCVLPQNLNTKRAIKTEP